jgi:hypothetical protein
VEPEFPGSLFPLFCMDANFVVIVVIGVMNAGLFLGFQKAGNEDAAQMSRVRALARSQVNPVGPNDRPQN